MVPKNNFYVPLKCSKTLLLINFLPKPCKNSPIITVMKYHPSDCIVSAIESISIILAAIKKPTPKGDILADGKRTISLSSSIRKRGMFRSPNYPGCYRHHGFTQGRKEILQQLALLAHSANSGSQDHAEHDKTKNIGALTLGGLKAPLFHGHWNFQFISTLLLRYFAWDWNNGRRTFACDLKWKWNACSSENMYTFFYLTSEISRAKAWKFFVE